VDVVPTFKSAAGVFSSLARARSSLSQRTPNSNTTDTVSAAHKQDERHEFLCVGDWGRGGILPQRLVAHSLARTAAGKFKSKFKSKSTTTTTVISTGDNFYNHGVKTTTDKRWSKSYEDVYESHPELRGMDFLPVLGNHDHLGDPLAQVAYTDKSTTWNLPSRYSAQMIGDILLVRLDTTPYAEDKSGRRARRAGFIPDPQTVWFKRVMNLAEYHRTYVLVVGHHNMYTGSTCGHKGTHHLRNSLEHILVRYRSNLLAYVCGHEHALMHLNKHGIDHIVSGGGSLLDAICTPSEEKMDLVHGDHKYKKTMSHRGVLNGGNGAKFVNSTNGFFKINFNSHKRVFKAVAINEHHETVYSFEKIMRPLPPR